MNPSLKLILGSLVAIAFALSISVQFCKGSKDVAFESASAYVGQHEGSGYQVSANLKMDVGGVESVLTMTFDTKEEMARICIDMGGIDYCQDVPFSDLKEGTGDGTGETIDVPMGGIGL